MKQNFTQENLIAYLYKTTNTSQRLAFEDAMRKDPALASEVRELRRAKRQIPQVKFNAPDKSMNNILRYSQQRTLEQQV